MMGVDTKTHYNASISACEKAQQRKGALGLLQGMTERCAQIDGRCYTASGVPMLDKDTMYMLGSFRA